MTDTTAPERRRMERMDCALLPPRQSSVLVRGARRFAMSLMDLHVRGARLRFMDISSAAVLDVGDDCRFNIRIDPKGLECGPVPCNIVWKLGAELGVSFGREMDISPLDA